MPGRRQFVLKPKIENRLLDDAFFIRTKPRACFRGCNAPRRRLELLESWLSYSTTVSDQSVIPKKHGRVLTKQPQGSTSSRLITRCLVVSWVPDLKLTWHAKRPRAWPILLRDGGRVGQSRFSLNAMYLGTYMTLHWVIFAAPFPTQPRAYASLPGKQTDGPWLTLGHLLIEDVTELWACPASVLCRPLHLHTAISCVVSRCIPVWGPQLDV